MKKVVIVLALVVLVLVPVAAKGIGAIGLEAGDPSGITWKFDINKKWEGYAILGLGFRGYLDAALGSQYKITEFQAGKLTFDVKVGGQVAALMHFGTYGYTQLAVRGTGAICYNFSIENTGDFTVYLRLALGPSFRLTNSFGVDFGWTSALGCVYYL